MVWSRMNLGTAPFFTPVSIRLGQIREGVPAGLPAYRFAYTVVFPAASKASTS